MSEEEKPRLRLGGPRARPAGDRTDPHPSRKVSGNLAFSCAAEMDADRQAVRKLRLANIPPESAIFAMERLAVIGDNGMEILSTHPDFGRRLRAIREQIDAGEAAE